MNWSGKFENRCSAYGRCPEIFKLVPRSFQKNLSLHCRKMYERFSVESACCGDTMYCNGCHDFVKKEIFKWKERCSIIVTVKCCLIVVQSCADIATTSSKGKNEQVESALFSRHERENTCTYFYVSLVFLSNCLIRKLQIV